MRRLIPILILLAAAAPRIAARAGQTPSPYAGDQHQEIKSLPPDQIEGYLNGRGMGLAKAAELNHYPGPLHVLDLAKELRLTPAQVAATRRFYAEMQQEAVRLGKQIVARERALDQMFATGNVDEATLARTLSTIGKLQTRLRYSHLRAHLRMRRRLTRAQIARYDELRGYTTRRP
jgi:Spy/CpxP family protein refolding chaperone